MAVSPARSAAFEILIRVEREDAYASELLHSPALSTLSSRDHGLATELVMGALRWRSLLDERIALASSQKIERLDAEVLTALRLGVYQLGFLSRVPARAAIFESVELVKSARKRSAASFVNAVLRKVDGSMSSDHLSAVDNAVDTDPLARNAAHPRWLVERWVARYGLAARQVCRHDQTVPESSIYISSASGRTPSIGQKLEDELAGAGVSLEPGRLLTSARRIVGGDVAETLAYKEGRVSIQDEGSQLIAVLAGHGEKILDCCAAPGSKASLVARRNPGATMIATELHPHRARLLQDLGRNSNIHVIAADARRLPFSSQFDRILVDVPCSGTGTLARNPEIKWRLKPHDLDDLQARQMAILKSALGQLSPNGRLIYSTCSMEREENEMVVERALTDVPGFEVLDMRRELQELTVAGELRWADIDSLLEGPYLRTIPGVHPCDGFFAAAIVRRR